ncbi:MAG: FAD-dependent oxidoreductase [Bacteroidetes bacterium]|nr:MAG: FAD-dependent oxidoreductase [Bacteroidota bacterium]
MKRRELIKLGLIATASSVLPLTSMTNEADTVLVVGAGISGLAAAKTLKEKGYKVIVLESRDRTGGRMWTDKSLGFPFDMGAAWIHGPDGKNPITAIAKKAGCKTFLTDDDKTEVYDENGKEISDNKLDRYENEYEKLTEKIESKFEDLPLEQDISLDKAVKDLFPKYNNDLLMQYMLSAYSEFDAGGALDKLSAKNWQNDSMFPGEDVLVSSGYEGVIKEMEKGLDIRLNQVVSKIEYDETGVTVSTNKGNFDADYAIITLPLGVLKKNVVSFDPPLPNSKVKAIEKVGMGNINKVALVFEKSFWDNKVQYYGYTSPVLGMYNYFLNTRTFSDVNCLVTFGLGQYGLAMESQTNKQIQDDIMKILKKIFGNSIPNPKKMLITRWNSDKFSYGAYSYNAIGSDKNDYKELGKDLLNRVFFAGEHTSPEYRATVHGAYLSGIREAEKIMDLG